MAPFGYHLLPKEKYAKKNWKIIDYGKNRMHTTSSVLFLFLFKRKMTALSDIINFRSSTSLSIVMSLLEWISHSVHN